jgi:hypothetical protein
MAFVLDENGQVYDNGYGGGDNNAPTPTFVASYASNSPALGVGVSAWLNSYAYLPNGTAINTQWGVVSKVNNILYITPTVPISALPTTGTAPSTNPYSGLSDNGITYGNFGFGDGLSANSNNLPSLTVNADGTPNWEKFFEDGRKIASADDIPYIAGGDFSRLPKYIDYKPQRQIKVAERIKKIQALQVDVQRYLRNIILVVERDAKILESQAKTESRLNLILAGVAKFVPGGVLFSGVLKGAIGIGNLISVLEGPDEQQKNFENLGKAADILANLYGQYEYDKKVIAAQEPALEAPTNEPTRSTNEPTRSTNEPTDWATILKWASIAIAGGLGIRAIVKKIRKNRK